jgi:hypothetical protein
MSKIYAGQYLRLIIDTKIDLTEATSVKICYITPAGETGEWLAEKDPVESTKMVYDISAVPEKGTWTVYGKATFEEGYVPGEPVEIIVYQEGQIN